MYLASRRTSVATIHIMLFRRSRNMIRHHNRSACCPGLPPSIIKKFSYYASYSQERVKIIAAIVVARSTEKNDVGLMQKKILLILILYY